MIQKIVIVGAGISGLSMAWQLRKRLPLDACEIQIFESASRPGGCVWTERIDGWQIELGPNGFLDGKPSTLALCNELGLSEQLVRANPSAAKRFVQKNERLIELPTSPGAFLRSPILSWRGKMRALSERFRRRRKDETDESIYSFGCRRFGREATESILDAMVTGIYAGDSQKLSLKSCFPRLDALEREYGSLLLGMAAAKRATRSSLGILTAPTTGMGTVIERLHKRLGECVILNTPVVKVSAKRNESAARQWIIETGNGDRHTADAVVLTCPSYAQAAMLEDIDAELASEVAGIVYSPAIVATLGYAQAAVGDRANGFGYLTPQRLKKPVLGVIWSSSVFPNQAPAGHFQFRAILGGGQRPDVIGWTDKQVVDEVQNELRRLMGLTEPAVFSRVYRWQRAIPQYFVGHQDRLNRIGNRLQQHAGLYLAGNCFRGVAINDCTLEADNLANELFLQFSQSARIAQTALPS